MIHHLTMNNDWQCRRPGMFWTLPSGWKTPGQRTYADQGMKRLVSRKTPLIDIMEQRFIGPAPRRQGVKYKGKDKEFLGVRATRNPDVVVRIKVADGNAWLNAGSGAKESHEPPRTILFYRKSGPMKDWQPGRQHTARTSPGTIPRRCRACHRGPRHWAAIEPPDGSCRPNFLRTRHTFQFRGVVPEAEAPVLPARQAYSHSASVGRRYLSVFSIPFSFLMNAWASFQQTCSTGQSFPPSLKYEGLLPMTRCH